MAEDEELEAIRTKLRADKAEIRAEDRAFRLTHKQEIATCREQELQALVPMTGRAGLALFFDGIPAEESAIRERVRYDLSTAYAYLSRGDALIPREVVKAFLDKAIDPATNAVFENSVTLKTIADTVVKGYMPLIVHLH